MGLPTVVVESPGPPCSFGSNLWGGTEGLRYCAQTRDIVDQ